MNDLETSIEKICDNEIVLDFNSNGEIINLEEIQRKLNYEN